jgi:hypothetical protein
MTTFGNFMTKLLFTFILLLQTSLFAIVTVKPLDIGEKPEGYSGELSFSWNVNEGNSNTDARSAGLYLQQDYNESLLFIKASYDYGESLGTNYMDKSFLHARRIHRLYEHIDDEVFMQEQSDAFQSLTSRTLVGAGLRWHNGDANKSGRFYLGLGAFYLTELETNLPEEHYARANFYFSYKYAPSNQYTFAFVSYYQPRADDTSDYLLLSTGEINIALSEKLALKFSMSYNVNSDPALGVVPEDYSQNTAIKYTF